MGSLSAVQCRSELHPPYLGEGDGTDPVLLYKSLRCTSERVGGGTAHARLGRLCCLSRRRRRRADCSGVGVFALGGQWGGPATSGGASRYPQPRRAGFATPSTAFEPAKCGWRSRRLGVPGYQHSPGSQLQRRALRVWPGWLTGATSPPPNERRIPLVTAEAAARSSTIFPSLDHPGVTSSRLPLAGPTAAHWPGGTACIAVGGQLGG